VSDRNESDERDPELARALGALPRALEPSRDLWPGVAARVAAERRRASLAQRAATGGAFLLAAASVALALKLAPGPLATSSAAPAPVASEDRGAGILPRVGARADTEPLVPEEESYRAALAALAPGFEQRVGELPPATAKAVDASVAAIDGAIAATRESLESAPSDADLRAELDAEYEQEIQTMNDVLDWTTRS
jgi:hypothetical protein